jgi:hypothetical protein
MKYSRFLATAVLAGCFSIPAIAQAQFNNGGSGSSNYGIFGNGAGLNGGGSSFGRSSGFGQNQFGSFGQQSFGGSSPGSFGRSGAVGVGSSSVLSPYLNMLRPGDAAVNYYALVRPQIRQQQINVQNATSLQQTDRWISDQQQRMRQGLDTSPSNPDVLPSPRKAEAAGQAEPRRRANDDADADFHDWSKSFKDKDPQGDAKPATDSRQRATALRQAKELKALEDELSGKSEGTADGVQQPRTQGVQPNYVPASFSPIRPVNHYYPTQGATANRMGGPR